MTQETGNRAPPRWPRRASVRPPSVVAHLLPRCGGIHCNSGRFNTIPSSSVTSSVGLHEAVLFEDRTQTAELVARFLLPVAAVERQHQLGPPALAQRLGLDSRVEIGHQGLVVAELQPPVEAVLLGTGVTFTQPHGNGRPLRPLGQVGNRFTTPQLERAREQCHRCPGMARRQECPPPGTSALETNHVHGVPRAPAGSSPIWTVSMVPSGTRLRRLSIVPLQRLVRVHGLAVAPQCRLEVAARHGRTDIEGQVGQDRAFQVGRDRDLFPLDPQAEAGRAGRSPPVAGRGRMLRVSFDGRLS